jgi:hypothetical protein
LVGTPAYEHSRRARYRIEALFAELKQRMRLPRVRLRRLWNVWEQFLLAATAQNLKRLMRYLAQRPPNSASVSHAAGSSAGTAAPTIKTNPRPKTSGQEIRVSRHVFHQPHMLLGIST